ncbi:hypothetical protein RD055328_03750 [Companilactobacillus sp. RD055328]|uniref:hypothetical protein n=1 Tax=Companilactobacillus sp. RD055328 TaxID=2916634 RepID=UPI001FC8D950|nr:hypothetical protein [Companilactobacillus sp. RD055328]GKQ42452.1 hypothetical protein RD055328_03750 [Companilactobacillus sp. RD055328]
MKITVEDYIEFVENEKYATKAVAIKESDFDSKISAAIDKAVDFGEDSLDSGKLFEYQINVGNTTFLIQSGIINLPFQDAKKVTHFFEAGQEVETKIYLITKSEFLNKSKFRIEEVSDNSELNDETKSMIIDFMKNQLAVIEKGENSEEE